MIIPCIDLMGGVTVQLVQGRDKAIDAGAPDAMLKKFAAFPVIQVIDLDAAIGTGSNESIVGQLAEQHRVRVGGGIRTIEKAQRVLDLGAEKIIVGTSAFSADGLNHGFLRQLTASVPKESILLALDSLGGRIVVKGWRESLELSALELIQQIEPYCGGCLCTYVDKEGMMQGTNLEWFRSLRANTALEITAAGGISTYEEVQALLDMQIHVALGMAIYTGRMDLARLAALSGSGS